MASKAISPVAARAMAKRVLISIGQLQAIRQIGVPARRVALIEDLLEQSQTYLVFLEEIAGRPTERARPETGPLLSDIQQHCQFVAKAWDSVTNPPEMTEGGA